MKIEFGWAAPTIATQFPHMDKNNAMHFQRDSEDLSRLKIRGMITETEHRKARQRLAKAIFRALGVTP